MTDIVSKFKSNQNKGIIWALLNEHNVFNGIDIKYVNNIKTEFDTKIDHISNTILTTDNLITLNKKVISEMMNDMTKYKTPNIKYQPSRHEQQDVIPLTIADAQLQKQTLFQKNLETKQSEFDTLINKPKPNTIDFSDNNGQDKPNSSEMERKLAETIAWREKQLNVVLDTQNNSETSINEANISMASKWINRDNVSSSENNLILKIDNNTPVDINVINLDNKFKKKVSFPDTKERVLPIADNFLSLLKKKETQHIANNTSYNVNNSYNLDEDMIFMKTQLKELMDKQNIILENQTVMLKIINELHIKAMDVVSPEINLEITE